MKLSKMKECFGGRMKIPAAPPTYFQLLTTVSNTNAVAKVAIAK